MMHSQRQSEYICDKDNVMVRETPNKKVYCKICNGIMRESKKGVITKAGVFSGKPN
jgi:hypothetical protein